MHNNHWINELRRDYYRTLFHESHVALWRFKCREEDALSQGNFAAATIAATYLDAERDQYWRIKERLNSCS